MAKDFIQKHPRLVFLLIGMFFAILTNWGQYEITKEYTNELEKMTATQEIKIASLVQENKQLSQKTKTYKIVKPDGTIEERTESEMESSSQVYAEIQTEYRNTLETLRQEIRETIGEKRPLEISAGITHDMRYTVNGSYNIWGPATVGAGMIYSPDQNHVFWLQLGIKL